MRMMKVSLKIAIAGITAVLLIFYGVLIFCHNRQQLDDEFELETRHYAEYLTTVKNGHGNLRVGLRREDVELTMSLPPDNFFFNQEAGTVTWHWNAGDHVGNLHKSSRSKGYFSLSVIFDKQGSVQKIYAGEN